MTDIVAAEGIAQTELLQRAASLEAPSEHPLSRAILQRAEELGLAFTAAELALADEIARRSTAAAIRQWCVRAGFGSAGF